MKKVDKQELHEIFQGIQNNDTICFHQFYEKYKNLVYAIAFSILKNKENSEDIVQKVYIKIWNMDTQKLPKNNELGWIYSLTKNEAIDFIKSKKTCVNIEEIYYIPAESNELDAVIDKDSYHRILSKLNPQEQEIVSLKILSQLTFKEISQILQMPESTVKWKYYTSMHTLQLLLGNLGMFIITFAISWKTMLTKSRTSMKNETQENNIIPDTSTSSSVQPNVEKQEVDNIVQEETIEQVGIQTPVNTHSYWQIGMVGIASIFLMLTIIFTIILVKHQLNRKHQSSK